MKRTLQRCGAIALCLLVNTLTGCGGSSSPVTQPVSPTNELATGGATYIVVGQTITPSFDSTLLQFPSTSMGTATATLSLSLPATIRTFALTSDSSGQVYVGSITGTQNAIFVYPPNASGTASPIRTIYGNGSQSFAILDSMATDTSGKLYVLDPITGISVFDPMANGVATPLRLISGALTNINGCNGGTCVHGIAVDGTGNIYVGAEVSGVWTVEVFSASANGNVAPVRTITGTSAGLFTSISALAIDASNNLYVVSGTLDSGSMISEFAATAEGVSTPERVISNVTAPQSIGIQDMRVDAAGNIWVLIPFSLGEKVLGYGPSATTSPSTQFTVSQPSTSLIFGQILVR